MHDLARQLGEAPRPFDAGMARHFHLPPVPNSLGESDPLRVQFERRDALMQHGVLVLGRFALLGTAQVSGSADREPTQVIYTTDPSLWRDSRTMWKAAKCCSDFHETQDQPEDPWGRVVAGFMRNRNQRFFHLRLPPELSNGRPIYSSTTMVFLQHLPGGLPRFEWMPMLVDLDHDPATCMIVPSALWPRTLLDIWGSE